MRASWIRVSPKYNDKCPYKEKSHGRTCEDGGRDWSHAATANGQLGPPEAGGV